MQLLLSEIAAAEFFNDCEKFFGSLDIPTLLAEAVHNEFPPRVLSHILQQHLAPRVIQVNGFSSEAFGIFKSILAGILLDVPIVLIVQKYIHAEVC